MIGRRIIFRDLDDDGDVVYLDRSYSPCFRALRTVESWRHPFAIPADVAEKVQSSKRQLRNPNDGSFAVFLDEPNVYLAELVKEAQKRGLTVSGDGTADAGLVGGDITKAGYGDIVTFGTSTRFDVNWIKRRQYACERSLIPIHLVSDWDTVMKALKAFAKEKKDLKYYGEYFGVNPTFKDLKAKSRVRRVSRYCDCPDTRRRVIEVEDCRGIRAKLHDDFIKVGYEFIPVKKTVCEERREIVVLL